MASSGPIVQALAAVATAALVLVPATGTLCGPCGPMDGVMDCCDYGPGSAGEPERCPGDALCAPEPSPPAADLSAPAPVPALAEGLRSPPTVSPSPGSRAGPQSSGPALRRPHLYLLHASFLI